MIKTAGRITALLGVLALIAVATFMGCAGEDTSITDPNGQLLDNNYGTNGLSFGDDPIQIQDGNTTNDGTVLPTNVIPGQNQVDTLNYGKVNTNQTK